MSITPEDLQDFNRFAGEQLAGDGAESLVELVHQWAAAREREDVNAAIRAGLKAIDEGRSRPFDESQDEFRAAHDLPPRR